MNDFGVIFVLALGGFIAWKVYEAYFAGQSPGDAPAAQPPPLPKVSGPPLFDLYRDARGNSTMFGFPVVFSSKLESGKYPNIVTGLTLNQDYVAVRRGAYGVKAFLTNHELTVGILPGCPAGFHENSDYMMELESETELARFPISFPGWLQIVDAARRGGATIEVDPELPGRLKDLIETPLPGDESIKPVRTKAAGAKKETPREVGRCKSCGANIGRKSSCDYCGATQ
jgi:hypothetical protein